MASPTMLIFHNTAAASELTALKDPAVSRTSRFRYSFHNFLHPFVGDLIQQLNQASLSDLMDPKWLEGLKIPAETPDRDGFFEVLYAPEKTGQAEVASSSAKEIDVSNDGPYAIYNWELFFHIPLTIAVHLSKTQRFAEAQRWFHYIFDPTCNDRTVDPPRRFWKFLKFRSGETPAGIERVIHLLSRPKPDVDEQEKKEWNEALNSYQAILDAPFQPHVVARTRPAAYQYCVVMKYLDNLIAWGDHLFQQDTIESINEATQCYVLAANILGTRPQRIPPRGAVRPMTFRDLRNDKNGLGPIGNALVELEGQFPLMFTTASTPASGLGRAGGLFGLSRTLYFGIPRNEKLLGYWDTVADRLFKIRHSMNIAGVVRPLALFDPPLDPGMLVKAAAAGLDIGSIVSGLHQPIGPVRAPVLIQKALELASEVRGLGSALLSALEKGDAEHLALIRQRHELQIERMTQEIKLLNWKAAREATASLLTSRKTALEKLHYYQRLLGLPPDQSAPEALDLQRQDLTEENFDETYGKLVEQYDKTLTLQKLPSLKLAGDTSPAQQSGTAGPGSLYLNANEDDELNQDLPAAKDLGLAASVVEAAAGAFYVVPDGDVNCQFWGVGPTFKMKIGTAITKALEATSRGLRIASTWHHDQAGMAARTAAHQRRADEWLLQHNLAAHELMQLGRQILTSLIAEQIARHDYLNVQQQIANSQEVDEVLRGKFTNEDLHLWMQGELSRLYYEYYRFAFDTARRAERTMKQELMRPELDTQDFVKFNYWDHGRKGLLSGEALYLDVKRMDMAYHDYNRRELELTRNVSLRQLDPVALLALKTSGTCEFTIPEWIYDLDCPGHYMRRIKSVALSIPSVVGPYTSVNCTLSLLRSSLRTAPEGDDYAREDSEDRRFIDYTGAVQSIVTSTANNDSGLFETNLRDERFLPFEGAGAESTWKMDLPQDYRAFDYDTISDVILHIRYTARQGVDPSKVKTTLSTLLGGDCKLPVLFSLRHDFPSEWSVFASTEPPGEFSALIRRDYFPYLAQPHRITVNGFDLYVQGQEPLSFAEGTEDATAALAGKDKAFTFRSAIPVAQVSADVFLVVRYSLDG